MIERRLTNIPWGMIAIVMLIAVFGLSGVYSATYTQEGPSHIFYKQIVWMILGIIVMFIALIPDYHTISRYAYVLYAVSILLLLLVMFVGKTGMGAQRWLPIGPFAFQPSEVAKLALLLALAKYYSDGPKKDLCLTDLALPALMVLVPFVLVLRQPDLGTAIMLALTSGMLTLIAGLRLRAVLIALITGSVIVSSVLLVPPIKEKVWGSLKPYQQNRIKAFIDPSSDPLGSGYQANQSKIAVGSGRIWGKGFREGTQSQMAFLPERHTDFIFSVIAEERGLIGAGFLILLYLALLLYGVDVARNAKDRIGALMASAVVCMLLIYVFINIGMAIGIAPVVGVPLPLASYGGTSVVTTFLAIGLLVNIQMRRFMLFY